MTHVHMAAHVLCFLAIIGLSVAYRRSRWMTRQLQREIVEKNQTEEELRYLATHDDLTGLPNRRSLDAELCRVMAGAGNGQPGALLMIDVDQFKAVNDTYGHIAADRVLVQLSSVLVESLRKDDLLFRWGGDEFIAALPNTELSEADEIVTQIKHCVHAATFAVDGHSVQLDVSVGVAPITSQACEQDVVELADAAMFGSKGLYTAALRNLQITTPGL